MKKLPALFVIAYLIFMSTSSYAITQEKERDIQRLMKLLDVSAMPEQMAEMLVINVIAQERKKYPNMSAKVEHSISSIIRNIVLKQAPELFKMVAPLYDKYYTHSEIRQLIEFFDSPIGRKYSAVLQPMMQDMIPVAQKWGDKFGPVAAMEVEKELKKLGYE